MTFADELVNWNENRQEIFSPSFCVYLFMQWTSERREDIKKVPWSAESERRESYDCKTRGRKIYRGNNKGSPITCAVLCKLRACSTLRPLLLFSYYYGQDNQDQIRLAFPLRAHCAWNHCSIARAAPLLRLRCFGPSQEISAQYNSPSFCSAFFPRDCQLSDFYYCLGIPRLFFPPPSFSLTFRTFFFALVSAMKRKSRRGLLTFNKM